MDYIHYSGEPFNISKFKPVVNRPFWVKPDGGLWASPINSDNNWYTWCRNNMYKPEKLIYSIEFDLSPDAKVLKIHNNDDLTKFLDIYNKSIKKYYTYPDFEQMVKDGYDAIEVLINTDVIYFKLYGWDCDTLLVFNPDVIVIE